MEGMEKESGEKERKMWNKGEKGKKRAKEMKDGRKERRFKKLKLDYKVLCKKKEKGRK